jgi:hypothetical protein
MPPRTANPDEGSLELTEDIILARAYRFFEERGCNHGHDLEDWLRAEPRHLERNPLWPNQRILWAGPGRTWRRSEDGVLT